MGEIALFVALLAILLAIIGAAVWILDSFFRGLGRALGISAPRDPATIGADNPFDNDPPTERQMAYIEILMGERDVDPKLLEVDPTTVSEASTLIDALKQCPRV